jgi:hypothetical protein
MLRIQCTRGSALGGTSHHALVSVADERSMAANCKEVAFAEGQRGGRYAGKAPQKRMFHKLNTSITKSAKGNARLRLPHRPRQALLQAYNSIGRN